LTENGEVTAAAFQLTPGKEQEHISVNWLEFLELPDRKSEIAEIRRVLAAKGLTLRRTGRFAVLQVGEVLDFVRTEAPDSRDLQILHEPEPDDPSHSGIFGLGLGLEDDLIAELIAQTVNETHNAVE
jgi:hypothetical protein